MAARDADTRAALAQAAAKARVGQLTYEQRRQMTAAARGALYARDLAVVDQWAARTGRHLTERERHQWARQLGRERAHRASLAAADARARRRAERAAQEAEAAA